MTFNQKYKTLRCGIKEIYQKNPSNIFTTLVLPLFEAFSPFLNITLITYCIYSHEHQVPLKKSISFIFIILVVSFFITFISDCLSEKFIADRKIIFQNERKNIIEKLFFISFEKLDNYETQNLCNLHSKLAEQAGSPLYRLATQIYMFNKGIFTLILSSTYLVFAIKPLQITFSTKDILFIIFVCFLVILSIIFILKCSSKANKKKFVLSKEFSKYETLFDYYFNIISTTKNKLEIYMNQEGAFLYNKATELIEKNGITALRESAKTSGKLGAKISTIGILLTFCAYSFFTNKALIGDFSSSNVVIIISTIMQIIFGITSLVNGLGKFHLTLPVLDCYMKIKALPVENSCEINYNTFTDIAIEFQNVYFKYANSEDFVINNVSFKIKKNDIVGIVGTNGSGKSTLIKLVCGLYKPTKGNIYINGIDTKTLSSNDIKQIFGVVFQDFNIFPFTISENIATSNDYNTEKILNSLKDVDLYEKIISLPANIYSSFDNSLKNSDSIDLSTGESQKIAIARTKYFNKAINIYDEPTSALDPYAESEIYSMIHNTLNSTAIFISHRLSTCKFCKKILVLDNGEIKGYDSHDKLISNNNTYKNLWNTQTKNYYLEDKYER